MGAKAIKAAPDSVGIVGTFHVMPYGFVSKWGNRALGIWLRSTLKRFNALYAATPAASDFARWCLRIPVETLPHAVDIDRFKVVRRARPQTSKLNVVFLGRLVQRKGALQHVKAIAAVPDEIKQKVQVRIGGKGEQSTEITRLLDEHDLHDFVQLDGFISEEDKPAYLAAADIAIFPSISGESFGISLIEPMAAGAGVTLGGNNPGYSAVLGAWPEALFDPTDIPAFTTYLREIVENGELREKLHDKQMAAVEQYDVNGIGKRWLEIYEQAIAENSSLRTKRNVQ
jgi:phosphatidylinositol alpha-mannosyltransferase